VLTGLISLHVLAVLFYTLVKRQGLIQTMWHGVREWPQAEVESKDTWRTRALALVVLACVALGLYVLQGWLPA
jgi:cytochrome b561